MRHDDAAERTGKVAGSKGAVGVEERPEFTDSCGEEMLGNNLRKEEDDDEVVKLEDAPEGR